MRIALFSSLKKSQPLLSDFASFLSSPSRRQGTSFCCIATPLVTKQCNSVARQRDSVSKKSDRSLGNHPSTWFRYQATPSIPQQLRSVARQRDSVSEKNDRSLGNHPATWFRYQATLSFLSNCVRLLGNRFTTELYSKFFFVISPLPFLCENFYFIK